MLNICHAETCVILKPNKQIKSSIKPTKKKHFQDELTPEYLGDQVEALAPPFSTAGGGDHWWEGGGHLCGAKIGHPAHSLPCNLCR